MGLPGADGVRRHAPDGRPLCGDPARSPEQRRRIASRCHALLVAPRGLAAGPPQRVPRRSGGDRAPGLRVPARQRRAFRHTSATCAASTSSRWRASRIGPAALVRFLEQDLHAEFGGAPGRFQLVEEDAQVVAGHQRDPAPRPSPGGTGGRSGGHRSVPEPRPGHRAPRSTTSGKTRAWFSVERQAPHETGGGKVYHVHRMTRGGSGRDHRG